MKRNNGEANQEMRQGAEREIYLKKLFEQKEGKVIKLFKERLQKIAVWLSKNKRYFTEYKEAEKEFEEFVEIETRKPQSDYVTTLSLDVSPEIGKAISNLYTAKRSYYSFIRSADANTNHGSQNRLHLETDERNKI